MDYASANYHVATKSRTFLAELMPPHPVYVEMLSEEAQLVIGKHDERADEIHALLVNEGFESSPYVDIFDAGEVMVAIREQVKTYREAQQKTVLEGQVSTGLPFMLCNDSFEDFRCALVQSSEGRGDLLRVNRADMESLKLQSGSDYYFCRF
jgi:arginine N-succinyltransferase